MMTLAKDVVRGFYAALDRGDLDGAMALCSADVEVANPLLTLRGVERFRAYFAIDFDAYSARRYEVTNLVAEGDVVVAEVVMSGTHTGPLRTPRRTIPPTGRTLRAPVIAVFELTEGKIVRTRAQYDRLGYAEQLGIELRPSPAAMARLLLLKLRSGMRA